MRDWRRFWRRTSALVLLFMAVAIFVEGLIVFFFRTERLIEQGGLYTYADQLGGYGLELFIKTCLSFLILGVPLILSLYHRMARYRNEKKKLEKLVYGIPGGVFICGADEREEFDYVSPGMCHIFECANEKEFRNRTGNRMIAMVYPADRVRVKQEREEKRKSGKHIFLEFRIETLSGKVKWLDSRSELVKDENGREWFYSVILDVTEQHFLLEKIAENEERQRLIMEKSDNLFLTWDFEKDHVVMAAAAEKKLGYPCETPKYLADLKKRGRIHPEDYDAYRKMLREVRDGKGYSEATVRFKRFQGDFIWLRFCFMCQRDNAGKPVSAFGMATDIDAEMRTKAELQNAAEKDPLTGLYNKSATQKHIDARMKKNGGALIIIDLDNFKHVNDTYGHMAGDGVLIGVAKAMRQALDDADLAGRIGGDEFAVFTPDEETAVQRICEIQRILQSPIQAAGHEILVTCSAGTAFKEAGGTFQELYPKADSALYRAKKNGKNCCLSYQEAEEEKQVI
ncbi:MAG: diguanylate cyclase [Oscillospiraceae bacterium]|nr:diguanylate cyclase [Oscillospiraceae bacterium]